MNANPNALFFNLGMISHTLFRDTIPPVKVLNRPLPQILTYDSMSLGMSNFFHDTSHFNIKSIVFRINTVIVSYAIIARTHFLLLP